MFLLVYNIYICVVHIYTTLGKNCYSMEAIWMHTCVRIGFEPKTPLGGPISSQTIPNCHEWLCEHGWSILSHKWRQARRGWAHVWVGEALGGNKCPRKAKNHQIHALALILKQVPWYKGWGAGMILRNHTYLKVYKYWWILPILKTPTIKWLAIFSKKYFNFQGFYIIYIIIWRFLGWKKFTPSK